MRHDLPTHSEGSVLGRFGVAIAVGVLLGVLIDLWPFAAFPLAALTVAALLVLTLVRKPLDEYRLSEVAGVMLGLGGLFLYGVTRGLVLCGQSADFCGNANLVPLASLTVGLLFFGTVAAAVAYARRRTPSRRDRAVDD